MPPIGEIDPIIAQARKDWPKASDSETSQRARILTAKKFRAGDQWPSAIKIEREGGASITGQQAKPPRPCLVVDRLSQPVRQQSNTIKNAGFGYDVKPVGGGADQGTADIFKGYMRRVENQSRGEAPVDWAADGAIEGGIGWFRLRTDYVTNEPDPNDPLAIYDQELIQERITNNLTVYCDPSAVRPTRSDAQFMFVIEDMDKDSFRDKYKSLNGGNGPNMQGLEDFMSIGDMKGWVDKDSVRIAEYWRVTYETSDVKYQGKKRTIRKPVVKGYKINAVEVLEQWDWAGSRIPLIPVLGEEMNIDGKIWLRGMIEEGMDAQRMVNYTYSGGVEIFALGSKKAPMVPMESISNYTNVWDTRNVTNYSYLPFDAFDSSGRPLPAPILDTTEAPIQAAVQLMRTSEEAIKATTSTGDASLGNSHPNERSGRAIQALQAQSDLANNNYLDNVRRARIYAAELMVEIIPKITRPGQILHILGEDDETQQVIVGQPFQRGADGLPKPSPEGITPEHTKIEGSLHQFYDLNAGRYAVTVTVGKATPTKDQESSAILGDLIPRLPPEMAAVATPEFVRKLGFDGAEKLAKRLESALPPNLQEQPQGAVPPQVQQMIQQLQGQLQQASQMIQTDQVKVQGGIEQAKVKGQTDLQIEQFKQQAQTEREIQLHHIDNAARIEIARIGAAKEAANIAQESAEERLSTGIDQQHEVGMTHMQQQHEHAITDKQAAVQAASQCAAQGHDAAQTAQQNAVNQQDAEATRQHEARMTQGQQSGEGV